MPCLAAKPIVDGIEKDLQGRAEVVRLNATSSVGRELAARYGVMGVPTTLVIDGAGDVVHRQVGIPSRKKIVAEAMAT
jgi:thiol-disulfide isomerase/thioredoxin